MALGEKLREARLKKKLTASEVAAGTHMKVQTVEAIEREDFSRIPAPLYCKGFIKLYAEFVGLDPDPLLKEYVSRFVEPPKPVTPEVPTPHAAPEPSATPAIPAATSAPAQPVPAPSPEPEHDLFSYASTHPQEITPPKPHEAKPDTAPTFAPPPVDFSRVRDILNQMFSIIGSFLQKIAQKFREAFGKIKGWKKTMAPGHDSTKNQETPPVNVRLVLAIAAGAILLSAIAFSILTAKCSSTDATGMPAQKTSDGKPPEHYNIPVPPPAPFID